MLKGHTIHSSGQIEWFKNSVDDRSDQVGGKQRICTIDGYTMSLVCKGGLMYLSLIGKPTDADLERYPAVHPIEPLEWDPSVLDLVLILMNLGITPKGQSKLSVLWMTYAYH